VWLPPTSEQAAIVEYIERQTSTINAAISITHRSIDHLKEYRTRLIADVVTGKMDVREAAQRLEDETMAEVETMERPA
jgi:type I restriction enzyme S subunit